MKHSSEECSPTGSKAPLLALVVEDALVDRKIVLRIMKNLGYETVEACDGQKALDCLRQRTGFSLMLVDWNMPVIDGLEFLRVVRARPEFQSVPIFMVSSRESPEDIQIARAAGATDYIVKPFTQEVVMNKLMLAGIF